MSYPSQRSGVRQLALKIFADLSSFSLPSLIKRNGGGRNSTVSSEVHVHTSITLNFQIKSNQTNMNMIVKRKCVYVGGEVGILLFTYTLCFDYLYAII